MRSVLIATFLLIGQPLSACQQALILALDVSSSVDDREHMLQRQGVALALRDADVQTKLIAGQVALLVFEWGSAAHQRRLGGWTHIADRQMAEQLAEQIHTAPRATGTQNTALGKALLYAKAAFDEVPGCVQRTVDISGDGKSNAGPRPRVVRPQLGVDDITVNALVIADDVFYNDDIAELQSYFRAEVILGTGAFVETAIGFEAYADAIRRKLLREINPMLALAVH